MCAPVFHQQPVTTSGILSIAIPDKRKQPAEGLRACGRQTSGDPATHPNSQYLCKYIVFPIINMLLHLSAIQPLNNDLFRRLSCAAFL